MKKIVLLIILGILMPAIGTSAYRKDINVLPVNPAPPFKISIWLNKSAVSPGETISVSFRSSMNCYLTLLDHGSSGKITVIYPNPLSGTNNFVRAGRVYTFPPPWAGFQFKINGPPGTESILAYATLRPNTVGKRLGLEQSIGRSSFKSVAQNLFKDIVVQDSTMAGAGEWVTARQDFQVRGFSRANEPPVPSQPVFSQGANMSQQGQYQAGNSQPQNIAPQQTGVSASSANSVHSVSSPFYLLAVGSSTGKLRGCEEDARQFARIMTTYLNIPGSQVKIITGASATLNGIKGGFNWLRQNMGSMDKAIFFFSGHGSYIADKNGDETDGYDEVLIPHDFKQNDISTVIVDDELDKWFQKLPGNHVAFVDACHSGTITKALPGYKSKFFQGGLLGVPVQGGTTVKSLDVKQEFGETLIAATTEDRSALEQDGRGLFTTQFCIAVENGSPNVYEAFKKARIKVLQISGNQQDPVLTDPGGMTRKMQLGKVSGMQSKGLIPYASRASDLYSIIKSGVCNITEDGVKFANKMVTAGDKAIHYLRDRM